MPSLLHCSVPVPGPAGRSALTRLAECRCAAGLCWAMCGQQRWTWPSIRAACGASCGTLWHRRAQRLWRARATWPWPSQGPPWCALVLRLGRIFTAAAAAAELGLGHARALSARPQCPTPCVLVQEDAPSLFVWGGRNDTQYLEDGWLFHLANNTWEAVPANSSIHQPRGRDHMGAFHWGGSVWLYGALRRCCASCAPVPAAAHCAARPAGGRGGPSYGKSKALDDLWSFSFATRAWSKQHVTGAMRAPLPRMQCSLGQAQLCGQRLLPGPPHCRPWQKGARHLLLHVQGRHRQPDFCTRWPSSWSGCPLCKVRHLEACLPPSCTMTEGEPGCARLSFGQGLVQTVLGSCAPRRLGPAADA